MMKGKDLSLGSKILSAGYMIGMNFGYIAITKRLPSADEEFAIIQGAVFLALIFAPVDISMIIQNFRGDRKKEGKDDVQNN